MQKLEFLLFRFFVKPFLKIYLKGNRKARYRGFKLRIDRGVFHPLLFFSTRYFYDFLDSKDLAGKKFLELGCGSGLLSLLALRKGALVSSSDIDIRAVNCCLDNLRSNFPHGDFKVYQSNVFEQIPAQPFDVVAINPPYYFKTVEYPDQQPWYCGSNGEYFDSLFKSLFGYLSNTGIAWMILEENCDIDRIRSIASKYGVEMIEVDRRKIRWETSFIFRLSPL